MFDSVALNVVISLVFIYLLYSLLATIIQEAISVRLNIRARILRKGIRRMLDDGSVTNKLSIPFYQHPLIKYLGENKFHSKPSYLSAQNFSKVVIDLLRGKNVAAGENFAPLIQNALTLRKEQWTNTTINQDTLDYLNSIWADSQGDVEKFKVLLEKWFDDTMERASGWYKKQIQLILFLIGFCLAIIFNIDSVAITQKLSSNPKLAKQLSDNAAAYAQSHKTLIEEVGTVSSGQSSNTSTVTNTVVDTNSLNATKKRSERLLDSATILIQTDIQNINQLLGLGWKCKCPDSAKKICIGENLQPWCIIGWLVTALAISLGAPFWFDLLNKLMKLRASNAANTSAGTSENTKTEKVPPINPKG